MAKRRRTKKNILSGRRANVSIWVEGAEVTVSDIPAPNAGVVAQALLELRREIMERYPDTQMSENIGDPPASPVEVVDEEGFRCDGSGRRIPGFTAPRHTGKTRRVK